MTRLMILIVALFTCVLLCSCEENCGPGIVQITGRWAGIAEDYWDISPSDARILLTVTQDNFTVGGTLMVTISCNKSACVAKIDTLHSGTFQNRELVFTLRYETNDLEHEFVGYLERDRIDGIWKGKQLSTGKVWFSSTWHVERVD